MNEPCNRCPNMADRTLVREALCHACAEAILRPIREKHARDLAPEGFDGVGCILSPAPHWGSEWYRLECDRCSATWVGRAGEACGWCADRYERMLAEQANVVLRPELPDPDDQRRVDAVNAWAERLARAVAAGVVEEHAARAAWKRVA